MGNTKLDPNKHYAIEGLAGQNLQDHWRELSQEADVRLRSELANYFGVPGKCFEFTGGRADPQHNFLVAGRGYGDLGDFNEDLSERVYLPIVEDEAMWVPQTCMYCGVKLSDDTAEAHHGGHCEEE